MWGLDIGSKGSRVRGASSPGASDASKAGILLNHEAGFTKEKGWSEE